MDTLDLIATAESIAENYITDSLVIEFNESIKDANGEYSDNAIQLAKQIIKKFS